MSLFSREDADGWRRVHPATNLLQMWAVLVAALVAFAFNAFSRVQDAASFLADHVDWLPIVIAFAAIPTVIVLLWLATIPWWRVKAYRFANDQIVLRHGLLTKSSRTAHFDRVQAVDVVEPLIARIFGLAGVRIETAGGSGSVVAIEFLRRTEADRLREEILTTIRHTGPSKLSDPAQKGEPATAAFATSGSYSAPTESIADQAVLVPTIPIIRSIAGAVLNWSAIAIVVLVIVAIVFPPAATGLVPFFIGAAPWLYGVVNKSWKFTAMLVDDELNLQYGLAERRRQTIPLDRIHAIQVHQPVLWRLAGWWQVRVDIAGYQEDKTSGTTVVFPVGTLGDAVRVYEAVGPLSFDEIAGLARPEGRTRADFTSPDNARLVSPFDLRCQGVTLVGDGTSLPHAVVTHSGRLGRRVAAIDPSHIQEISLSRGPIQQHLGIATVRMDLVPGPVSMAGQDLDVAEADHLLAILRQRRLPSLESAHSTVGPLQKKRPHEK